MEDVSTPENLQEQLMMAFKFDEEDLLSNRKGKLSARQKKKMLQFAIMSIAFGGTLFLGSVLFPIFLIPEPGKMASLLMVGSLAMMALLFSIYLFWMYWQTYKSGIVVRLHGKASVEHEGGKPVLRIDGETIALSSDLSWLFDNDNVYNVYYSYSAKQLMSIEIDKRKSTSHRPY